MKNVFAVAGIVIKEMYRRKDFYVLLILTVLITGVMGSITFFNDEKISRYLKEICLLLIWVSSLVIAITTVARQMPAEKEYRTIFPLLAKPITRSQLLFGKFLGCWLACGIALACFYAFFGAIAVSREHHVHFVNYFQAATLHWFMLAILIGMALLGSLVFAAPSSNSTICFVAATAILLIGRHLNHVALSLRGAQQDFVYGVYYAMPHLEVFDVRDLVIHNWPGIAWPYYATAAVYALVYGALFVLAACLVFRRKALN